MDDYYYEKMYCECLNNCLTIEKYYPIKDFLHKLVKFYDNSTTINEKDFMLSIIRFCNRVVRRNIVEDLDKILNFIMIISPEWFNLGEVLETIVFPKESYEDSKSWYFDSFKHLTHIANLTKNVHGLGNLRIEEIIKIYIKYHDNLKYTKVDSFEIEKLIYFEKYVPIIIGYFYKLDREVNCLDKMLNDFINNYEVIFNKGYFSGICNLDHFASQEGTDGEYEFFSNLVEIDGFNQSRIIM